MKAKNHHRASRGKILLRGPEQCLSGSAVYPRQRNQAERLIVRAFVEKNEPRVYSILHEVRALIPFYFPSHAPSIRLRVLLMNIIFSHARERRNCNVESSRFFDLQTLLPLFFFRCIQFEMENFFFFFQQVNKVQFTTPRGGKIDLSGAKKKLVNRTRAARARELT